jgi:hypothetical protein
MNEAPRVLGLGPEEAEGRLEASGFSSVVTIESGRRREGRPRVIRQRRAGGTVELVVSWFKNLDGATEGSR